MKRVILLLLLFSPVLIFGQTVVNLDAALREAADYFYETIPAGSVIAILDFEADRSEDASRVMEELTGIMVNDRFLSLIDRGRLSLLIEREKAHQMSSGRVDDGAQIRIGHELGAHSIISGTITNVEGGYRLRMQSIDVFSGKISGVWNRTTSFADEGWKRKRFYLGAAAGFAIPSFKDSGGGFLPNYAARDFDGLYSLEGEIRASFAFIEYAGLQTGLIFNSDTWEVFNPKSSHYLTTVSSRSLGVPLMVKGMYQPKIFRLQAYGGVYLSLPLGQMLIDDGKTSVKADFGAPFGFIAGAGAGVKLGPGLLMIDGRYMSDLADYSVNYNGAGENTEVDLGRRQKVTVWLGYEVGF